MEYSCKALANVPTFENVTNISK